MAELSLDLSSAHLKIVCDILKKHVPDYSVWAFGSRVTGRAKPYSDLDLAVITDRPLALSVSAALMDDFSASDLPIKIDVVDWANTSEVFRKIILRNKLIIQ